MATGEVNVSKKVHSNHGGAVACDPKNAGYPADVLCGAPDARMRAKLRYALELSGGGSWPKLDPCPVHLREESEHGPRMCLDPTLASSSIPRESVWTVVTT